MSESTQIEAAPLSKTVEMFSTLAQYCADLDVPIQSVASRYATVNAYVERLGEIMESAKKVLRERVMREGAMQSESTRAVATPYGTLSVTERVGVTINKATLEPVLRAAGIPLEAAGDMKFTLDMEALQKMATKHGFMLTDVGAYDWFPDKEQIEKLIVSGRVPAKAVMPSLTSKSTFAVSVKADKSALKF